MLYSLNQVQKSHTRNRGFSLVEILIVIGVIALLLAMTNVQFRSPRPGHAAKKASGTIKAARAEAITAGKRSRVAICVDPTADGLYLRQLVGLIYTDQDNDKKTDEWLITSIDSFPDGTCFWSDYSTLNQTMKLDTTGQLGVQVGDNGFSYAYIEFDVFGECDHSSQWIFTQAIFDSTEPTFINEMDRDGFILRKTGKLAYFNSPEKITPASGY